MYRKFALGTLAFTLALPLFTAAASCPNLNRNLSFGSRGSDVAQLQQFLISQNLLSAGNDSGYFGRLTQTAVQQFQCRTMNLCSGSPNANGYGVVGQRTRSAITNACMTGTSQTGSQTTPNNPSTSNSAIESLLAQIRALQQQMAALQNVPASPTTNTSCVPLTSQTQTLSCPSGQNGTITQTRISSCPGPTWSSWTTTLNTCAATQTSATCTPLSPQTQTLTCPSGQTGSITQTRISSCNNSATSPTWSDWSTTTNTCVAPQKTVMAGAFDPIDWMTTNKGTGHVRGYFETWNGSTWVSGTGGVSQPFKMFADISASQIYWRKDMPAETQRTDGKDYEFSGEIYTFDASSVRLRSESMYFFPCPALGRCDPTGQAWDIRTDKFRLFANGAGPLDTTEGLFFMPRPVWNGWSHGPYPLATYYCNSFSEFHQSTCSLYQKSDQWGWVTVEAYNNYDIFNADGDQVIATPDGNPQQRIYDVLIVSQEQQVTNFSESVPAGTARGAARERFFYGKIGNDKYGFIRWDSAKNVNGRYVLDARTVGYAWDTSYNPQFSEMQARGAEIK